jgi:thymidine kinase
MQPDEEVAAARIVCSRCRTESTHENLVVRATDSEDEDEQIICSFCGNEFFDRVCNEHDTPEVAH